MSYVMLSRTAFAVSLALATAAPAVAAPAIHPGVPEATSNLIEVQNRRNDRDGRFERRGNQAYYNGHRGYRDRRPGYRQHNGFWFPPAAFIAGAIVGGAINQPGARQNNAHIRWCQDRWRSYRASDDTYQPYNGPRKRCVSPYS